MHKAQCCTCPRLGSFLDKRKANKSTLKSVWQPCWVRPSLTLHFQLTKRLKIHAALPFFCSLSTVTIPLTSFPLPNMFTQAAAAAPFIPTFIPCHHCPCRPPSPPAIHVSALIPVPGRLSASVSSGFQHFAYFTPPRFSRPFVSPPSFSPGLNKSLFPTIEFQESSSLLRHIHRRPEKQPLPGFAGCGLHSCWQEHFVASGFICMDTNTSRCLTPSCDFVISLILTNQQRWRDLSSQSLNVPNCKLK